MLAAFLCSCEPSPAPASAPEKEAKPYIVFVTGDEEYRSEESMPMLAEILKRELNAQITMCYSVDENGFIDPNNTKHINNLGALDSADLMVLFTRFRALPKEELQHILDYAESGKPMVGFRTSTHAFMYEDSSLLHMNNDWPTEIFGQQWITHHGHFEDGHGQLTSVSIIQENKAHKILSGVENFDAFSWLYHVDGGDWQLNPNCMPFLQGTSLRSNHLEGDRLDKYPLTNPVAWTNTYQTKTGEKANVFFTTLGHPYDFKIESMRKLSLNGIYWALGLEEQIPTDGVNSNLASTYDPNNSGFGEKFKKGIKGE